MDQHALSIGKGDCSADVGSDVVRLDQVTVALNADAGTREVPDVEAHNHRTVTAGVEASLVRIRAQELDLLEQAMLRVAARYLPDVDVVELRRQVGAELRAGIVTIEAESEAL